MRTMKVFNNTSKLIHMNTGRPRDMSLPAFQTYDTYPESNEGLMSIYIKIEKVLEKLDHCLDWETPVLNLFENGYSTKARLVSENGEEFEATINIKTDYVKIYTKHNIDRVAQSCVQNSFSFDPTNGEILTTRKPWGGMKETLESFIQDLAYPFRPNTVKFMMENL